MSGSDAVSVKEGEGMRERVRGKEGGVDVKVEKGCDVKRVCRWRAKSHRWPHS